MRHLKLMLMITLVLLFFTGCPEFFTFNLYEHLDPIFLPNKEKLNEMDTAEAINYLENEMNSDGFIKALVEDDKNTQTGESSALDDIDNYLEGVYTNPNVDPKIRTDAAVLAADLRLAASGASDVINNMLGAIEDVKALGTDSGTNEQDLKNVLEKIVPPEIGDDETAFKTMMEGFFSAADTYEALGDTNGILDSNSNTGDSVTGGVVMNAAVTIIIDEMATGYVLPGEDKADIIWDLYKGNIIDETKINTSFSMASDPFSDPIITNIADKAGIEDVTTLF